MKEFVVKYWLQVLFSGVLALLSYMVKKVTNEFKREKDEQNLMKLSLQALLRDRLIQAYNYHKEKGYCSIHNRDNVINMYNQYHKLGANGVIDGLIDEVLALPTNNSNEVR